MLQFAFIYSHNPSISYNNAFKKFFMYLITVLEQSEYSLHTLRKRARPIAVP
jgi:hypothetical protein